MAIATGTAAVIAAGVGAATQLGQAHMASRSANRAVEAEERARQAALDYQGSLERRRRADYRRQYEDWYRHTYGTEYGGSSADAPGASAAAASTSVGNLGTLTGANPGPVAGAVPNTMAPGTPGAPAVPTTPNGSSPLANQGQQPRSIADLSVSDRWSDWGRYGVGGGR